jgi:release factor glutamine methyltransferase
MGSRVWAMDISTQALAIARRNAAEYAPQVHFVEGDALTDFSRLFDTQFDMVVSNPPYIPASDMALMRPNVVDYEPHTALFEADDDPLIFYRSIARTARAILKERGRLYFEIYEMLSHEMQQMLRDEGYDDIVVREDFRGKQRMICARVSSITR